MGLLDPPALTPQAAAKAYAPGAVPSIITGSHTRGYDRRMSLYNLKPSHLRKTRAKLAKARLGLDLCRIALDGDSTFAGEQATPFAVNSIGARMQDLLVARQYPLAGTGNIFAYSGTSGRDGRIVAQTPADWPQTTGTLSDGAVIDSPITLTANRAGTIFELGYFSTGTAGTYELVIDGGAPETINVSANAGTYAVFSKTGLADTTHVGVLRKKTGGTMRFANFRVRRTTGVEVSSFGIGGSRSAAWAAVASGYNDMNPIFGGSIPVSDLRIANHMLNDVINNVTIASFKASWQTYIDRVLATGAELVLICNHRPGGAYIDTDLPYRAALYDLADSNDLPLVDFGDRFGTFTQAQAQGHMIDNLHCSTIGYFDQSQALFFALGVI